MHCFIVLLLLVVGAWSQTCEVLTDVAIDGTLSTGGDITSGGKIVATGDVNSTGCSESICDLKLRVNTLDTLTSNGTFCPTTTCNTLVSWIEPVKWPVFMQAIINTAASNLYTFPSNTTVIFGTSVLDRNSTYNAGTGVFTCPTGSSGFFQYGFAVVIDKMDITNSGGAHTVTFECGVYGNNIPALLDILVKFAGYDDTGALTVTTGGLIFLDDLDTVQVKCHLTPDNNADVVNSIHVAFGNFYMERFSDN